MKNKKYNQGGWKGWNGQNRRKRKSIYTGSFKWSVFIFKYLSDGNETRENLCRNISG